MSSELNRLAWASGRRTALRAVVMLLGLLIVPAAWAKPSAEELAVARQQFDKAVAAEGRNAWAECEEAIAEAIGIIETPGLRFHQAHCKEQQQKLVEALVDYKRAEELIAGGVKAPDVEPLLEPALTRLEQRVPKLTVHVVNAPHHVTFYLDGKERSSRLLGKLVQLNPGAHTVEVTAMGYSSLTRTISVKEGELSELSLRLEQRAQSRADAGEPKLGFETKPRSRERGAKPLSAKPFVLAGEGLIAAAALGLAVHFYVEKQSFRTAKDSKIEALELAGKTCAGNSVDRECTALRTVVDNEKRQGRYAGYCAVGGAVMLALMATTWLAWDDSPRVVVAYDPALNGALFTMNGSF
jgi:hypothetical protein